MYFNGNLVATSDQIPSLSGVQNQLNILSTQTAQIRNYAPLSGAAFTGAITVNGGTPLYSIPSTVSLLVVATFTGAVTTLGLSLGGNSLNLFISTTTYTLTTTMLKALVDNSWI